MHCSNGPSELLFDINFLLILSLFKHSLEPPLHFSDNSLCMHVYITTAYIPEGTAPCSTSPIYQILAIKVEKVPQSVRCECQYYVGTIFLVPIAPPPQKKKKKKKEKKKAL